MTLLDQLINTKKTDINRKEHIYIYNLRIKTMLYTSKALKMMLLSKTSKSRMAR
jgi:hypothetical protein